jgi:enamine deaminase RidA (YjgF/YER057c/UK114 family)
MHRVLQPEGWPRPKGYANGMSAYGRFVFTAGVVGWNAHEEFEADDLPGQLRQALVNTRAILAEGGASPEHVVRMTCYVKNRAAWRDKARDIGAIWREAFGKHYPCMAVVEVAGLMDERALVEIETTAVVPE